MTKREEKKKLCDVICFALNDFFKEHANVSIINDQLFWFSISYDREFKAREELTALKIHYDSNPKHWVREWWEQDFFIDNESWNAIREKYLKLHKN